MPHYLDILIAIPLLWAAYRGFRKGLVIELAGLAALVLGIYCALKFSGYIAGLITEEWSYDGRYLSLISFAITFIAVILLVHLLGKMVEKLVDLVSLGIFNKIAGALFSIAKIGLIISVGIWFSSRWLGELEPDTPEGEEQSVLYPILAELAPAIIPSLMDGAWLQEVKDSLPDELSAPELP